MSDFSSTRSVKATRKDNICEQCGRKIEAGSAAMYAFGNWDGYTYSHYTHMECHDASVAYAKEFDLWGEEWPWFRDMENSDFEHHGWLRENYPVVADRLNIPTKIEEDA